MNVLEKLQQALLEQSVRHTEAEHKQRLRCAEEAHKSAQAILEQQLERERILTAIAAWESAKYGLKMKPAYLKGVPDSDD